LKALGKRWRIYAKTKMQNTTKQGLERFGAVNVRL
jgi:hypothetical protein